MTGAADEARRALREARERHARESAPDQAHPAEPEPARPTATTPDDVPADEPAPPPAPGGPPARVAGAGPATPGARPGDAAREALRRAVAARRAPGDPVEPAPTRPAPRATGVPTESASETEKPARLSPPPAPTDRLPASVRPSTSEEHTDARPADVAREALRVARQETESRRAREETDGGRAPRPPLRPSPAALQLRDLGQLLDGAFRMPTDEDEPESAPDQGAPTHPPRQSTAAAEAVAASAAVADTGAVAATEAVLETGAEGGTDAATRTGTDAGLSPSVPRTDPPRARPAAPTPTVTPSDPPPSPAPAAAPRSAPSSMAAPTRDGELRRTYPPFPPRPSARAGADASFAETWWGNAWVTALEEGALDVNRLLRGRAYADGGHVDAITVTPGLVLAYVQGSRARPYRVQVRLRTLGDEAWTRFLESAAERTGHIAALLDKELPHSLADCGVPLLPGPGELDPQCSCPDAGHPCKHAAALCYQTARLLDADPFVLLLLRGRGERGLLDALSRLSAARAARAAREQDPAPLPGVRASEALARHRLPPLPRPLPPPPHPGQPPAYPASPGGPDPFALDQLATDAAARAHALLTTGRDPVGELTLWQDAVRLAAARPGSGLTAGTRALYASLAAATGRSTAQLARAVAAWRQGGIEGLSVLEDPWDPPAGRFDRARPLLLAADLPAFRPWRNHLTHPRGHAQLRLGRDGLWYAYESEPGHDDWWPRGVPDLDPVGALTAVAVSDEH
ncbi:SWIM zinc finger family protein [Streptomyces sp. NPDC101249]|uniref:SWIM zinc finger family protein n=1 Tax=Streptomyces sp. NPDC101249 TaxID=3366140 RepID=UPI00381A9640